MSNLQFTVLMLCLFAISTAFASDAIKLSPREVYVYLEAERFEAVGGWTIDAQFRQLMGSTYLLAAGIGESVVDALTKVNVPRGDKYHLWVRCKDWDETSPGAFQVLINGKASATTFGVQKKDWAWIYGGTFELEKGESIVKLHDLTGYYGRCDALILTTDAQFKPPDNVEGIKRLREQILGAPAPEALNFDFVVIGAGYGGVCAAVQASRLGLNTALIQNRPCLGGNASKEINVGPGGACPHTCLFRETGICEEVAEGRFHEGSKNWSDAIDLVVKDVPNLTIFLNTEGTRAVVANKNHIEAVEAENVVSGKEYLFQAPLFADCTGDGAIAFSAGAAFRHGQEARSELNESIAPEEPNERTMGTSILHVSKAMATPQPFVPPPFAVKFSSEHFLKRKHNLLSGTWWIEYGGMLDTIKDAEEIRDELIRVVFGAFDWAKNHDPATRDKAKYHKLVRVPTVGGKRESRRFIGDYTLTQNDLQSARLFPDRVAYGGWPIDLHPSPGIYGKEIPPAKFHRLDKIYSIPYRILYTRDVDNLFLAGRHVSVTHVALGSTRLMQTIGLMGQAVGAAAYLCQKNQVLPRGLYPAHIEELQQLLLKWDVYIPEIEHKDSGDLCHGARVRASSVVSDQTFSYLGGEPKLDRDAPCAMDRGQTMLMVKAGQDTLSLYLRVSGDKAVTAKLHVEEGSPYSYDLRPFIVAAAQIEPGVFHWVKFRLPEPLEVNKSYFVWLPRTPNLCWKIYSSAVGERVYGRYGAWTRIGGRYALKPFGAPMRLGAVSPEAAIDGLKWPLKGGIHQWRSDPTEDLPQWLEVDFGKSVALNTVYLTFDTNIFGRFPSRSPGAHVTAQDYRLLCYEDGTWKTALEEKGNWRRFRRHQFPKITTDKIRLEILKARNGNEARLYEIRAYNE